MYVHFRCIVNKPKRIGRSKISTLPPWKNFCGRPCLQRPCLPLSAVTVSLHYQPRCLRSRATCDKTPDSVNIEDLLPRYYYTIKTKSKIIRSQVWQLAPGGSNVTSPKIWVAKMFDFRPITLFCLRYRLSKHK